MELPVIQPIQGLASIPPPARVGAGSESLFANHLEAASRAITPPVTSSVEPKIKTVAPAELGPPRSEMARMEAQLDDFTRQRIDDAARNFEAVFLRLLIGRMQKAFGESGGMFGKDASAEFYNTFAWDQMADGMAQGKESNLGIGETIYRTLLRDEVTKLGAAAAEPA